MAKVKDIRDYLNSRIPFSTKLDFDNVGLLAGEPDREVHLAVCALDVTDAVIEEAAALGAELIVAHHPLIFHALKSVCIDDLVGRKIYALARNGISAICMHTNLDAAVGGVNDALMEALGCTDVKPLGGAGAMPRFGRLPEPMALTDFLARTKRTLEAGGLRYAGSGRTVSVVGCCGGSGGEFLEEALEAGCDTFVTADVRHDRFLAAEELDVNLIDGGHFSTENVVVPRIRQLLLDGFPELDVRITQVQKQPEKFYT